MKKRFILILTSILIIFSCTKKTEKEDDYTQIFNPNKFEGKYQSKVSILGTFHYANFAGHDYMDKYEINGFLGGLSTTANKASTFCKENMISILVLL